MSDDKTTPQASPEPFARKAITWGRMPQTTFHVGPVPLAPDPLARIKVPPRPQGQAPGRERPLPSQTPRAPGPAPRPGNILGGSLIPTGRPAPTPPLPASTPTPPPPSSTPADLTVRALPEPEPAPEPAPSQPGPVRPAITAPSAAAEPAVPAHAKASARRPSRLPLYVGGGLVALLLLAGGAWFATRPAQAPATPPVVTDQPAAPAPATPVIEAEAAATPEPSPATQAPVPDAETAAPAPRATTTPVPTRPVASTPTPATQPPAAEISPPQIETAPLVVVQPAPTPARPIQADPDGPIITRPQPLD